MNASYSPLIAEKFRSQTLPEKLHSLPILLHHISIPYPVPYRAEELPHFLQIAPHAFSPHTHQLARVSTGRHHPLRPDSPDLVVGQKGILDHARLRDFGEHGCQNKGVFDGLTRALTQVWRGRVRCITHHGDPAFRIGWCGGMIPHSPDRWLSSGQEELDEKLAPSNKKMDVSGQEEKQWSLLRTNLLRPEPETLRPTY